MQGLYKKIIAGKYSSIPSVYSQDMNTMIRACLQTTPSMRPNVDQILDMHNVQNNLSNTLVRMDSHGNNKRSASPGIQSNNSLLGTIKVPRNLRNIKANLPKSKYESNNPASQVVSQINQAVNQVQRAISANGGDQRLQRNNSEPGRIGRAGALIMRDNLQSAKPTTHENNPKLRGLAPIKEEDQPRSAEPGKDRYNYGRQAPVA
jgi:hypothetical protein